MFKMLLYKPNTKLHFLLEFTSLMYAGNYDYQQVIWSGMTPNGRKTYQLKLYHNEYDISNSDLTEDKFYTNDSANSRIISMNSTQFGNDNTGITTILSDFGVTNYIAMFDIFTYSIKYKHDNSYGITINDTYSYRVTTHGTNGFSNDTVSGNWGQYIVVDKDGIVKKVESPEATDTVIGRGMGSTAGLQITFIPYPELMVNSARDPYKGYISFNLNGYGGQKQLKLPYIARANEINEVNISVQPVGATWTIYDFNLIPYNSKIVDEINRLDNDIDSLNDDVEDLNDEINYVEGNVTSKFVSR